MALKSTIFKASLNLSDIDRGYYAEHALTLARHPSETDERLMVRLVAFARHADADERLTFGKGLSSDDEPDLWQKDLTGAIELWIEVGQPDERRIRQACGRARQVMVYCYGHAAEVWWAQQRGRLERLDNLSVVRLPSETVQALAQQAERTMQWQCTVQDSQMLWSSGDALTTLEPVVWKTLR